MPFTLAFDIYGTLINTSGVLDSLKKLVGEKAYDFMNTWRSKQLEYSFRRGLMNRYVDFSECTRQALEYCCLSFRNPLSEANKADLMNEYRFLPAFPEVETALITLRKSGHELHAFSNGSKNVLMILLENSNLIQHLDGIISVQDVSMFKPSPVVYEHFNKATGSDNNRSWLISGNPFDVIGAISYGMRAVWVNRSPEEIFDPWEFKPTRVISLLTDLEKTLEQP